MTRAGGNAGAAVLAVVLGLAAGRAAATNGFNLIAYGVEATAMGGADIAVARDSWALTSNPAGLSQIDTHALDMAAVVLYATDITHRDSYGNDAGVMNEWIPAGQFGYAQPLGDGRLTAGIGLTGQGGAGNDFQRINTAFGTRDDLGINMRIARFSAGAAWQATDALSLGASLLLTYADLSQKVFPDTSFFNAANPAASFYGIRVSDLRATGPAVKLGAMVRLAPSVQLGAAYTSRTRLTFDRGHALIDMSALGLGKVRYADVRATGIDQPQEAGVGLGWQATPRLLFALELGWMDWSRAVKRSTLTAAQPDNALAPTGVEIGLDLGWRDQYIAALGAAWDPRPDTRLWAGFNYANSPVGGASVHPLLALHARRHITLGLQRGTERGWRFGAALEWQLPEKLRYTNAALPFGTVTESKLEVVLLHLLAARRW